MNRRNESYEEKQSRLQKEYDRYGEMFTHKKICPVCGSTFFSEDPRQVYDRYQCAHRRHKQREKDKRRFERISYCLICGQVFLPERKGAKYCSNACKQRAYRARGQQEEEREIAAQITDSEVHEHDSKRKQKGIGRSNREGDRGKLQGIG